MSRIGLLTLRKSGFLASGVLLNVLLAALLLLCTGFAHASDRGWQVDRHGGYFGNRNHWQADRGRHFRRGWGVSRSRFDRSWSRNAWRNAAHRSSRVFIGGAIASSVFYSSALNSGRAYSNILTERPRSVTVVRDYSLAQQPSVPVYSVPRLVTTAPQPIAIPSSRSDAIPSTLPASRLLIDLEGNCYRITTNEAGAELRKQLDTAVCAAF